MYGGLEIISKNNNDLNCDYKHLCEVSMEDGITFIINNMTSVWDRGRA